MEDKKETSVVADESAEETLRGMSGAFATSVLRNPKEIKADRGLAIVEEAQTIYKRTIEDTERKIKTMTRSLNTMTDLSPSDKTSLNFADFDAPEFVRKHSELALSIRQEKIKLNVQIEQYNRLFGHTFEPQKID